MLKIVGVPEHFNFPFYLAQAEGAIDIVWADYPGGTGAMCQALRKGEADVAILLTEGIVTDQARGNPAIVVGTYVQTPLLWGIHTGAAQPHQSVADLKGKTFAISRPGSGSQLMVFELARQQGWAMGDFSFVEVGSLAGARQALVQHEAAGFLWERFMTQPEVDAGHMRRLGELPTPWPAFSVAVRPQVWASQRAEVEKVLNKVLETALQLRANPQAANLIAAHYRLNTQQVTKWLDLTEWATHLAEDEPMITRVRARLKELGVV